MPLKITYWTASQFNPNIPGAAISNEAITVSGSTAQSSATPANAVFVSVRSTDSTDTNFIYNSTNPTALAAGGANHGGIGYGERLWLDAIPTFKIAAITAS